MTLADLKKGLDALLVAAGVIFLAIGFGIDLARAYLVMVAGCMVFVALVRVWLRTVTLHIQIHHHHHYPPDDDDPDEEEIEPEFIPPEAPKSEHRSVFN